MLTGEFALKNILIQTNKLEITELVNFIRSTNPSPFIFILKNSLEKGICEIEGKFFFDEI